MGTRKNSIHKQSFVDLLKFEDALLLFEKSGYLFGSLLWKKQDGKKLNVLDWGDCYRKKDIDKWFALRKDLEINAKLNFLWCIELSKKYDEILKLDTSEKPSEKERQFLFQDFGFWFCENCTEEILNQDLITVTHYYFENLSEGLNELFFKLPEEVRRRNLLVASHMVITLILCRYTSFDYLQDVYNTCLLLDYKLSYEMWSNEEKENILHSYKKSISTNNYFNKSNGQYINLVKKELKQSLTFKGASTLLDLNFEKLNGDGFKGKKEIDMCDEDSILTLMISLFSEFEKNTLLKKAWGPYSDLNKFPIRIKEFIKQSIREVDDEYLAVEGL